MRIASLLLLVVVGSAQCFSIQLYNDQATPITVDVTLSVSGASFPVSLAAPVNGVPSKWTRTGISGFDTVRCNYQNLRTTIGANPTLPGYLDIKIEYASLSTNTNVAMEFYFPAYYPEPTFMCNWNQDFTCYSPEDGIYDSIMTATVPNVGDILTDPFQIWFTNKAH